MTSDLRQDVYNAVLLAGPVQDPTPAVEATLAVFATWLNERADTGQAALDQARDKMANHHVGKRVELGAAAMHGAVGALRTAAKAIQPSS